jgi:hypothetical protein
MNVHRVDLADRRDVRRFLSLPFRLYRSQPLWVPPFTHQARAQLNPSRHPFYQHSQAAFFLATDGGDVVGRIAAIDNTRFNAYHNAHTAFFYLFDSVDDQAVAQALFDAAGDWARSRGLDRLWGPKGFSHLEGQGILVEGFEHRPAMGVPYNHPYYGALVEGAGLAKAIDFYSFRMDRSFHFPDRYLETAAKLISRRGYRSVVFHTKDELRALIPRIVAIYNESFVEVQGYTPMTEAEGRLVGERILDVADPALISVLMRGEEVIGFVVAYPDVSAAIQRCHGRMWPVGWLLLLRELKRTRWINFNGMGIRQAHRGLGGTALLFGELYRILIDHPRYDFGDLVQVQETNARMIQELTSLGVKSHKRHRIYEAVLG